MRFLLPVSAVALLAMAASPALAQRWGYPGGPSGWDRYGWDRPARSIASSDRSREGKVEVTRFLADGAAAQALGKGTVSVSSAGAGVADDRERATYEAAVIDRLAAAGYDTAAKAGDDGQTVELNIRHAEIEPAEAPHKPLSGAMEVGVSNRGSYTALGLNLDMRKPLKALMSTRLEARIRDHSGAVLWEGRADIATRDGDPKWTDQAIATKLAGALFAGFPGKNGETIRG
jgi:hypothetical protein